MDLGIAGKVAVVTGAGRGIGRAVALALGREGAQVALVSRTLRELEEVAGEIADQGGTAAPFVCDVTNRPQVGELSRGVTSRVGPVEILVSCASRRAGVARLEDTSDVAYDTVIRDNLEMTYSVTKAFLPGMQQGGWGRLIYVGSLVGEIGGHGQVAYATAKAAMLGFVRTVAIESGRHGITANLVVPGAIEAEREPTEAAQRARDLIAIRTALKRLGRADEVASTVAFLASTGAAYLTGAAIPVTGGFELNFG